jgi:hypothetical protein
MLNSTTQNQATPSNEAGNESTAPEQSTENEWREYLFFREEMRHEDNLINQRVSWLIGSQAFLLGGFATLVSAGSSIPASALGRIRDSMLIGLPVAGILGVVVNYVTILAAILHVRGIQKFVADRTPGRMPSLRSWHNIHRRMGLFGPLTTPPIFLAFWVVILWQMR